MNECSIKVLGMGCKSCHDQHANVIDALANMNLAADVEYVTDPQRIIGYGAMSMPAIVVNEKVVSMGKVLKPDDVTKLLEKLGY